MEGAATIVAAMNAALLRVRALWLPGAGAAAGLAARLQARLEAWAEAERGRFMPWLAVFMAAGVLGYFNLGHEPPAYAGPALAGAAAALRALLRRHPAGRAAALALLASALGFTAAQAATWRAAAPLSLPRTAVVFTATVGGVETLPEGRRLTLVDAQLDGGGALARSLHLRLRADDEVALAAGDRLRARAVLRPPAPPAYPGARDLQREAFFSGLGGAGMALGPVSILVHAEPSGPARWLTGLREAVARRVTTALPGTAGAVAATMLTGLGGAIPAADRAAFRDSGLAHLLAVAGLHIGIVMGLVMGAARFGLALWERAALHWPCKQVAALAALAAGAGYVLLTGMHVPALRSFVTAALVTLAVAIGRRAVSMRGLAVAAIALMLLYPEEVVGVSFQMSFAAVLALIAGYEALRPSLARLRRHPALHHAGRLLLTSLLAGAASAPFAAYHFGRAQAYFLLGNLVAVPLTAAVVMPSGLLALLLMPAGLERLPLAPMGWALEAVLWVAHAVAALPGAAFGVPHMPGWGLAVVALGLAWLALWRTRPRLLGAAAVVAGLLSGRVSPPADMLVSSDARLIALHEPAAVQTRPGFSRYVLAGWGQYWAEALQSPFPEDGAPGAVRCDREGCRIERGGAVVLLARSLKPMDCAGAALVVSAEPARAVCPALPRVDRFSVWRDGAQAVWLHGGAATVVSDRSWRGERPWVPPVPTPAGARVTQPLALEDEAVTR